MSKCRSPSTAILTTGPSLLPFRSSYPEIETETDKGLTESNGVATNGSSTDDRRTEYRSITNDRSATDDRSITDTRSATDSRSLTSDRGVTIGSYTNCTLVADGVTSEVYRWGTKALKVITTGNKSMEPHNPQREIKILESLRRSAHLNIIELLDTFRADSHGYQESKLVLVFNYMPLTLADLIAQDKRLDKRAMRHIFDGALHGLEDLHSQGIIHRDIKPSAILLSSDKGPARISDFGTAWHPEYSSSSEPPDNKILDVGTGPYRAPDCLFGNKSYTTAIDMWSFGIMVSEAITCPLKPIIESRPAHEDGSQLGLILSIFKTLGTPTKETWPEAADFRVSPFEMWKVFPQRHWTTIMPGADRQWRDLVAGCLRYGRERLTASRALEYPCFENKEND